MPRTSKGGRNVLRKPITSRVTEEVKQKLEAAAEASGRSLAQEIELRLIETLTFCCIEDRMTDLVERLLRLDRPNVAATPELTDMWWS